MGAKSNSAQTKKDDLPEWMYTQGLNELTDNY